MTYKVDRARDILRRSKSVVVLTGAGISAESGVPTFRDAGGLWRNHRPEDLATPLAFDRDPVLVWQWYHERRRRVAECHPNGAHVALAEWAVARRPNVRIVTQNVDGLHARAAGLIATPGDRPNSAALPVELHGSLFRIRCTSCGARHQQTPEVESIPTIPHCRECDAPCRPDVIWFGEPLDDVLLADAIRAARAADACLVVGTSAVVYPAASIALITKRRGGALIEVNPEPTPLSALADVSVRATAVDAVPRLVG